MSGLLEKAASLAIINAAGFSTRVGGSCPAPEVLEAMAFAQRSYFEIDDLLALASEVISQATGSEAGLVTCGAGAGLTLAAAAVLAGSDVELMDRLPDVSGLVRTELLYPSRGRFDYDHPLRLSGAALREVEIDLVNLEDNLERAAGPATAGIVYVWKHRDDDAVIRRIAAVSRRLGVPFILDAAMALPPAENLRKLSDLGPNLITISGGKHLGGPQNSGMLFGDKNLIDSAWIQMVDMDVRPASWSRGELIESGFVPRPPRHGVGRAMKVGKDAILGCLVAVARYADRDFAAERERWHHYCARILQEVRLSPEFTVQSLKENSTAQYPVVELRAQTAALMEELKRKLKALPRKIILGEHETDASVAYIYPICLADSDIPEITRALSQLTHP